MDQGEFSIKIPERFYSDVTDQPFSNCNVCGKSLLENDVPYVIEKAMRNYKGHDFSSTIYEFAICQDCHVKMQKSMSEDSISSLQKYYSDVMTKKGSQPYHN